MWDVITIYMMITSHYHFVMSLDYDICEGRATSKSKRKEDPSECIQNAMASVGRKWSCRKKTKKGLGVC